MTLPHPVTNPPTTQKLKERWRQRLLARGEDAIMLAVYAVVFSVAILYFILRPAGFPAERTALSLTILGAILAISLAWEYLWDAFPKQFLGQWTCLIAVGTLSFAFGIVGQANLTPYLLFMNTAQAVITLRMRQGLIYSLALYATWIAVITLHFGSDLRQAIVMNVATLIGMVFSFSVAALVVRYGEQTRRAEALVSQLQQANTELAAARARERELVVNQERIRLAREIHDGLGHHLTALAVQLQAANSLIDRDPTRAFAIIKTCTSLAQQAMDEVRNSVAVMRQTPLDGRSLEEALNALIADFNQHPSVRAVLTCTADGRELPPAVAITLYRAAQEGLTNCRKHAGCATRVQVSLGISDDLAQLTVADNGQGSTEKTFGHGFGLAGLRERAEHLGGSLATKNSSLGGFELVVQVPLPEGHDD